MLQNCHNFNNDSCPVGLQLLRKNVDDKLSVGDLSA